MSVYSPFGKDLKSLQSDDLIALKTASEGWYIEYKQEAPNATSIAKSISAFANTYGGWLFYGIAEHSREDSVAGSFPGIAMNDVDSTLQRMRQAVAGQIYPCCHFERIVLWGPCESIGLPAERAVICAQISWSPIAPHVHKNGVIYRRVADGSEPKPENDRFLLDQLWRRPDSLRKEYQKWIERDPEFSEEESKKPFVRLLLVADLWQDRNVWIDGSIEEFRTIFGESNGMVGAVPFDTVHTTADGFIARQLANNDPHNLTLSWRFNQNLVSEVLIPLPLYTLNAPGPLREELHGYDNIDRFVRILQTSGYTRLRVVDLNYLFNLLIGLVEIQQRLIEKAGWKNGYFIKARLLNSWRTTPFLDVPAVLDSFENHGVPMCLDSEVTSPRGNGPDTFLEVPNHPDVEIEVAHVLIQTVNLFAPIASTFGLPAWIESEALQEDTPYYEVLQLAGRRAMTVQRLRSERTGNDS